MSSVKVQHTIRRGRYCSKICFKTVPCCCKTSMMPSFLCTYFILFNLMLCSSCGVVSRSIELKDDDENSGSDTESIDDRGSVANSVPGNLGGDPSANGDIPASTVANHVIEKLVIENNIFLKAALQLLDQRDHSIEQNSKSFSSREGSSADVIICGTAIWSILLFSVITPANPIDIFSFFVQAN